MVTTIEPPLTLFKEQEKTVPGDAVEPAEVALGLVPKVLNPIDVVLPVHEPFRVIDPHMVEVRDIQRIIASESVSVHDTVRQDHTLHDGEKCRAPGVWDHDRINPPSTLQQAENRDFPCSTSTALAFPDSSEVALINFNLTVEWRCLFHLIGNDFPQPSEKRGRRVLVDVHQLSGSTCRCAGNEVLNEPGPLLWAEPAFPFVHDAILSLSGVLS